MSRIQFIAGLMSIAAMAALVACARNDGSEWVGQWEPTISGKGLRFEIAKTGDTFLLIDGTNSKFPATYDTRTHILNVSFPLVGPVSFSYDASTHKVLAAGDEYQKATTSGSSSVAKNTRLDEGKQLVPVRIGQFSFDNARPPASPLEKEAAQRSLDALMTVLANCNGILMTRFDRASSPRLIEVKEPRLMVEPELLSEADKANGKEWSSRAQLQCKVQRILKGPGPSEWTDCDVFGLPNIHLTKKAGLWVSKIYPGAGGYAVKPLSCAAIGH